MDTANTAHFTVNGTMVTGEGSTVSGHADYFYGQNNTGYTAVMSYRLLNKRWRQKWLTSQPMPKFAVDGQTKGPESLTSRKSPFDLTE